MSSLSYLHHFEPGTDPKAPPLLLLHGNIVLTFAESPTTAFDPVIERIRTSGGGRIRRLKADYLSWAILDMVVDNYLFVMDQLDEAVTAFAEAYSAQNQSDYELFQEAIRSGRLEASASID